MENMNNVEFWRFWNTFAPWLSGIGSLFAVIVSLCSLYITLRDRRPNLLIETYLGSSINESHNEYICVYITNRGRRIVTIEMIYGGFEIGFRCMPFLLTVYPFDDKAEQQTGRLEEEAGRLEESERVVCKFLIKDFLSGLTGIKLGQISQHDIFRTFIVVRLTTGKIFEVRCSKEIRKELIKKLKEMAPFKFQLTVSRQPLVMLGW
jgi:hypothetical protein